MSWSAPVITTGGVGDRMWCASDGGGEAMWYDGNLGMGETRGIVGVPNGEGERE